MNFDDLCERFRFAWDMNGDSIFSVSDVGLLAKAAFLLPSNVVAAALHSERSLASFFEIDCTTGQGWGGALFSLVAWTLVCTVILTVVDDVSGGK